MVIIMGLSKIEIITGMQKFNGLKRVLSQAGVGGMTFTQVLGCGREKAPANMKWMNAMKWSFFQNSRSMLLWMTVISMKFWI